MSHSTATSMQGI